jgi:hypothetical protein
MELAEELERLAETAVQAARERFQVELDYSPESVKTLDRLLERVAPAFRLHWLLKLTGSGIPAEQTWRMAHVWGAYLGVTMQRSLGGKWALENVAGQEGVIALDLGAVKAFPVDQVYLRLTKGRKHSLWSYFEEQRRRLNPAAAEPPPPLRAGSQGG